MTRVITITQESDGHYIVAEHDRFCDGLGWDEMLGHIASMTMPKGGRMYPMLTAEENAQRSRQFAHPVESECDDWSSVALHLPFDIFREVSAIYDERDARK